MDVLLTIPDAHVRDAARSALLEFDGVEVTCAEADEARHLLRRRRFDLLVTFLRSERKEIERLVQEARSLDAGLDVVAFTPRSALAVRRGDKNRLGLYALLAVPVVPVEVFETFARWLTRRRASRRAAPAGSPTRR